MTMAHLRDDHRPGMKTCDCLDAPTTNDDNDDETEK